MASNEDFPALGAAPANESKQSAAGGKKKKSKAVKMSLTDFIKQGEEEVPVVQSELPTAPRGEEERAALAPRAFDVHRSEMDVSAGDADSNWRRGNDFRGDVEERRGGRRDYEDRRGGFEGRGGFGAEGRERRGFGGGFGSRGEGEVFDRSMFGSRQPEGETEERRDRPRLNLQPRTKPVPEIERKDEPEMSEEKTRFTEGPKPVEAESYTGETLAAGERRKLVLKPRTTPVEKSEGRTSSIFGAARPREEILKEKGVNVTEKLQVAESSTKLMNLKNEIRMHELAKKDLEKEMGKTEDNSHKSAIAVQVQERDDEIDKLKRIMERMELREKGLAPEDDRRGRGDRGGRGGRGRGGYREGERGSRDDRLERGREGGDFGGRFGRRGGRGGGLHGERGEGPAGGRGRHGPRGERGAGKYGEREEADGFRTRQQGVARQNLSREEKPREKIEGRNIFDALEEGQAESGDRRTQPTTREPEQARAPAASKPSTGNWADDME